MDRATPLPGRNGGYGLWSAEESAHLNDLYKIIVLTTSDPEVIIPWELYELLSSLTPVAFWALVSRMTPWRFRAFLRTFGPAVRHHLN